MKIGSLSLLLILNGVLGAYNLPEGFKEIQCELRPFLRHTKHIYYPYIPGPESKGVSKKQLTSTNWGGYVAANNLVNPKLDSVSAVYGSWKVPLVQVGAGDTYCAIWVGIDGYNSSSVEQIGTSHDWVGGKAHHYAWFEMYPDYSYEISGFPIAVGDLISASVEYKGNHVFTMRLSNHTRKVVSTIPASRTTSSVAQRKSAEWIVEAPFAGSILPLSHVGAVQLTACTAKINNILAPLSNTSWPCASLEMVTDGGLPKAITSTVLHDRASFITTWKHQ